ncbi:MAG: PD40 domain-containing protein, partial [Anaerolineae bacterium]|nr:PD40 domain-containing protein [Anaerolineae bacterium]
LQDYDGVQDRVLYLLDPRAPDAPPLTIDLPLPATGSLVAASASPDGEWLMLLSHASDGALLQIFNPTTGETREVQLLVDWFRFPYFGPMPLWSPDSNYLAYLGAREPVAETHDTDTGSHVMVYSLQTNASGIILRGEGNPFAPYLAAWSPDSSGLVAVTNNCEIDSGCRPWLSWHDVPPTQFYPLIIAPTDQLAVPYGQTAHAVCDLAWSPDGRLLAFEVDCDYANWGLYTHDIYIWDTLQNAVSPLTTFTTPLPLDVTEQPGPGYFVDYDYLWYDATTLLVGRRWQLGTAPESLTYETAAYSWPAGTSVQISSDLNREWTRSTTGLLAFRAETLALDGEQRTIVQNRTVQIADFDGATLTTLASGPSGCDLRWSPDGDWLAYSIREASEQPGMVCFNSLGYTFLNTSGTLHATTFTESTPVIHVGWVRVE